MEDPEEGRDEPSHDLEAIKALIRACKYETLDGVLVGLLDLGMDEADLVECVLGLTASDFHKSMESRKRPGLWQDVYKPIYCGERVYVKLQIMPKGRSGEAQAVVLSFKRK